MHDSLVAVAALVGRLQGRLAVKPGMYCCPLFLLRENQGEDLAPKDLDRSQWIVRVGKHR